MITLLNYKWFIYSIYFSVLMLISLFVRDIPDQFNVYFTIDQIIKTSSLGDPVSFLTGAIDVSKNGWFTPANQWLINLWPPGFMLIEGYILKLFGEYVYIILTLQILSSLIFSFVLIMIYGFIPKNINRLIAFFIPLILFIFPVSRVFLLEPTGVLLGESFSIGFFLLFVLFMLKAHYHSYTVYSILAGLFLGISAYFRSQFETILVILSLFGIFFIIFNILRYKFNSKRNKIDLKNIRILFYIIITSVLITLPWRIYNKIHNDRISWVATSSLIYSNLVSSNEKLLSIGGGWIVEGKGNMICLVNPSTCDDIKNSNPELLIKTFLGDPILWYQIKFIPLKNYWFSELGYWTSPSPKITQNSMIINNSFILMCIFIVITICYKHKNSIAQLLGWIFVSLFITYLMIFTVVHFETRYFYFPKIFIIFLFLLSLIFYFREKKYA
ncbi:hypothetical protein [Sulfurimonas sp.]|uniref:hypothetical protein n=1 Tax=Sulfurimonas sp. TaxID=2022749 RepID=UPI00262A5D03|nr:hypothetical protein [Sulfurimonas sp.]MDD5157870.1 hypothetical protein [Sulfurimonas sp.]